VINAKIGRKDVDEEVEVRTEISPVGREYCPAVRVTISSQNRLVKMLFIGTRASAGKD
jgi:hypothetical protein